ncbi:hypothetical protein LCGC14_0674280 [marine sediment metagenome]|uniref:Uncharacterized protein n=1 Tax=marine sediment metagenome TaxID=412755 RepID=A0A0F9TBN0_9ZZZZ
MLFRTCLNCESRIWFWQKHDCILNSFHVPLIAQGHYVMISYRPDDMEYNTGPSEWKHEHMILYPNAPRERPAPCADWNVCDDCDGSGGGGDCGKCQGLGYTDDKE